MDFGFGLNPSSAIELDKQDLSLYNKLCRIEPTAATCIACGSCSATCTAAGYSGMSVRKLLIDLQRGRNQEVEQMLSHPWWKVKSNTQKIIFQRKGYLWKYLVYMYIKTSFLRVMKQICQADRSLPSGF